MAPPLPPSSKTPRRRSLLGNTNSEEPHQQNERSNSETHNISPRLASRRHRDDDDRPTLSSSRYSRETRLRLSSSSRTADYLQDDERNHHLPPSTSTGTKSKAMRTTDDEIERIREMRARQSKSTMTTDDEIERIRELRARRQRAERQERGVDSQDEKNSSGTNISTSSITKNSVTRPSRHTSIAREDLEKSGLIRKDRRRQIVGTEDSVSHKSNSSNLEGLSNSRDGQNRCDTAKKSEKGSKRSEIEARLAARRSRRYSADGPYKSTVTAPRYSSETLQMRTENSNEHTRSSRKIPLGSSSLEGVGGIGATMSEEANVNLPSETKSMRRGFQTQAPAEVQSSEDKSSASIGETPNVRHVMDSYENRGNKKPNLKSQVLPPRTSSNAISERLRERREARERDRKEREKKYDLKGISTEQEATQSNKFVTVDRMNRDENKSKATERNSACGQEVISGLGMSDEEDDATSKVWSLRLCVISAMDLPSNIVPNMPLCPVLKMGLVKLPADFNENSEKKSVTSVIMEKLGDDGIEKIKSAKTRSTTNKILSKRDNGNLDFHQEYRWDNLKKPLRMGLCVELFARAVRTPSNYMLSPPAISQYESQSLDKYSLITDAISVELSETSRPTGGRGLPAGRGVSRTSSLESAGARLGLWNRNNKKQNAEMQAAEAAAAVARILVDESGAESTNEDTKKINTCLTRDAGLGSLVIPFTMLPQGNGIDKDEAVRLEQWHQLESGEESLDFIGNRKKPSILLEISLSSSEVLDDSEDELEDGYNVDNDKKESLNSSTLANASFSRRACIEALYQTDEQESKKEKPKTEDPVLEPGVVDFVAVIGCKDIGNQKNDDGMKGWVKSTPDYVVLEQFPPNNEFHLQSGRKTLLPEMLQWFCYPEGAKLWRGVAPPSHSDLNLERVSAASPLNVTSSTAAFDACLNCTTSFSWFVIASNSDVYGSGLVKTYTAVIRFYVPAPTGIDSTQDDFAQAIMGEKPNLPPSTSVKRLWVPMAICLTSNLPIIGIMEALLLRTCEELATISDGIQSSRLDEIQQAIGNIILKYQKPIAGAVNCSVPFLAGDRFLLSLPPRTCLPPLPHGRAMVSVCRLLGAEGLNYLTAAVLSECKILLHSHDIAEISMVAEVITALTYPFAWSLPYIPVLPVGMIEFVEAPLSYLLGIPSCNLKLIDPRSLDDTVVVDLNKAFTSSEYSPDKLKSKSEGSKHPPPLPATISTNLSNAVYKLILAEEQMEEEYGGSEMLEQSLPRLETESLAEREFRVTVAIEICGLLRGYQECLGPVFNRDKFLKIAPALYEERREYKTVGGRPSGRSAISEKTKVLSSRSKRFLSSLVSGQNFQQLLETLDSEEATFFHEILELIDESTSDRKTLKRSSSDEFEFSQAEKNVALLMKSLQKNEDKVPTYCVEKEGDLDVGEDIKDETLLSMMYDDNDFDNVDAWHHTPDDIDIDERNSLRFMKNLLSPIEMESTKSISDSSMQAVSMEYLAKLETTPWQYKSLFNISPQQIQMNDKIKLREAIGERRFRAWKSARDKKSNHDEDLAFLSESTTESAKQGSALDLTTLVTSAKNDSTDSSTLSTDTIQSRVSTLTPAQQRIAAAKSRDIIRRCLDRATVAQTSGLGQTNPFMENGRDLMAEAEKALRNPSAQLFLVSILAQRSRLDNKRTRTMRQNASGANVASRLDRIGFDCLIRLGCAMLDSCMEYKEFEMAYRLLTNSAGFIMVQEVEHFGRDDNDDFGDEQSMVVITMTSRIGLHPIFADIGVWEAVMVLHLRDRKAVKKADEFNESDDEAEEEVEYEAAVATLYEMVGYGIPGEELSRFAMRASQEHGWFCDDRGRQLLMLARRISIRRDQADMGGAGNTGDIDMVRKGPDVSGTNLTASEVPLQDKSTSLWRDVAWCHPSAPSRFKSNSTNTNLDVLSSVDKFMKRTPVTAIASFGSSIVASGGLDGGVFLAHSITFGSDSSADCDKYPKVRGIHLDWGSASRARIGSTSDGEYGVGAVSCLAASYGDTSPDPNPSSTKDAKDMSSEIDIAESMEGSRIIAGTTAGDLRVWSVKDIYSSISTTKNGQESRNAHTASRLKYSLRGRALSGHRGGVTCIDVPSQVYRPDSLVTGGADGLIKLWALRAPTGSRRTNATSSSEVDLGGSAGQQQRGRGGDALSTLSGHAGRILCIKTAWHGDHLLSGGADRTVRVWDLATSGGKCIHRLCGHFGWITNVQYWGPNTIVSASTDRSVALWDARVRSSPLFILRNHQSPISDLLVGSRTDPYMVSAAADGTIATWDFRSLSDTSAIQQPGVKDSSSNGCKIVRLPSASIHHNKNLQERAVGSVHLSRDVTDPINSFFSVGSDAILRKWNITTGDMVEESSTGHCDSISSFESYAQNHRFASQGISPTNSPAISDKGFLTSSLDGTIRMRKLVGMCSD